MATMNLFKCTRSISILALLCSTALLHAQPVNPNTDPTADSNIRKDAPSMQKDGTGASATAGAPVSKDDMQMMGDMANANLAEIETGKLALEKSQTPEVKKFAQQMIDDHTQAQADLRKLAQSKGVDLPNKPDKKHQAMAEKMQDKSGEEFDRMYLKQVGVNDHQKTLKLLQKVQKNANDPELKALAAKTKPIVEQHLKMGKQHMEHIKSGQHGSHAAADKGGASAK